jgi:hypothetical protein
MLTFDIGHGSKQNKNIAELIFHYIFEWTQSAKLTNYDLILFLLYLGPVLVGCLNVFFLFFIP